MLGVTQHLGLRNADVDVTFTLLRMSYQSDPDEVPVLLQRTIAQRDIDYDDVTRVHELVEDVLPTASTSSRRAPASPASTAPATGCRAGRSRSGPVPSVARSRPSSAVASWSRSWPSWPAWRSRS